MDPLLTSPKNPWIKQLRTLQQAKGRQESAQFLLEGTHLLQEALGCNWPLVAVCFTPTWAVRHSGLLARLPTGIRIQPVSPEVLAVLATTSSPDGVVAIAVRRTQPQTFPVPLGLALETVQDPGNLGTLIRTATAAGASGLWVTPDSVDPDHPKVLRASAGQWFRVTPEVLLDPLPFFSDCRQAGMQVLAATASGKPYWDYDLTQPTLFLLGNEGSGLSQSWLDQATGLVGIPMAADVESLNVGMAGGLLLYEARRQCLQLHSA